jgi:glycosyltransferase involved in cell wall biosynthesis
MLSIIIPALNEEKCLPIFLSEIKKQTFRDYEIIVADASSQDRTVEIARSFNCTIIEGGLPARGRNAGARIARGNLFLFMDADNIYLPERFLENLIFEFKKRNLDVAVFPIFTKGNWVDEAVFGIYNWWVKLSQNFLAHSTNSVLVKKEIYERVNGFDEEIKIGEDHDFARRADRVGKFGFIDTGRVLTSARRFDKEGRFNVYSKYFLAGLWMFFLGPIKSDIFKYRFNLFRDYNFRELTKQAAVNFKNKISNGIKKLDRQRITK